MNSKFAFLLLAVAATLASCAGPKTLASFSVPTEKRTAPANVKFTNASANADSYEWNFGDGSPASTEASPAHTFTRSGNYEVVLKATKGSKSTIYKQMVQVTAPERCLIEIETDFGTMVGELYNSTPKHRDNFIKLAEQGYYDGTLFHRVIQNFMIQGGDPNSRNAKPGQPLGMGGPSYQIDAEFVDSLCHLKGAICAARTSNPEKKSSGSQFYIVQGNIPDDAQLTQIETQKSFHYTPEQRAAYKKVGGTPFLDRDYTVYGRIIQGLDVLDKIAATQTDRGDRPVKDVKMKVRTIH